MPNTKYQALFFDLDHTLWDFEKNAAETLFELHAEFGLDRWGIKNVQGFVDTYVHYNDLLWVQYRKGYLDQATLRFKRFYQTLQEYGVSDLKLSKALGEEYISRCPKKKHVFPHTHEVLEQLKAKYPLYIVTNGFAEVQHIKLQHAQLAEYFSGVIDSQNSGVKKPHRRIFSYALKRSGIEKEAALMVGDDLDTDMQGALDSGWDCAFFNPKKKEHEAPVTFEISCLTELLKIV